MAKTRSPQRFKTLISSFYYTILFLHNTVTSQMDYNEPEYYLDHHNRFRAQVNVPPLKWNDELTGIAYDVVMKADPKKPVVHYKGERAGVNTFIVCVGDAQNVLSYAWVYESQFYDYKTNSCIKGQECRGYTQMVWRNTTDVGCYLAHTHVSSCQESYNTMLACVYYPRGNIKGRRPY